MREIDKERKQSGDRMNNMASHKRQDCSFLEINEQRINLVKSQTIMIYFGESQECL